VSLILGGSKQLAGQFLNLKRKKEDIARAQRAGIVTALLQLAVYKM